MSEYIPGFDRWLENEPSDKKPRCTNCGAELFLRCYAIDGERLCFECMKDLYEEVVDD